MIECHAAFREGRREMDEASAGVWDFLEAGVAWTKRCQVWVWRKMQFPGFGMGSSFSIFGGWTHFDDRGEMLRRVLMGGDQC